MLKSTLTSLALSLLLILGGSAPNYATGSKNTNNEPNKQTVQKSIVTNGRVTMDFDLNRLNGTGASAEKPNLVSLHFSLAPDSSFGVVATNNLFRTALPGSVPLVPQDAANLPAAVNAVLHQLVLEKRPSGEAFELVVRDAKTGFVYFNIEGHEYDYDAAANSFSIQAGRLLVSNEFARQLDFSPGMDAVGTISMTANLQPIEIQTLVNGQIQSDVLPPARTQSGSPDVPDLVSGPDVIVGDLPSVSQPSGSSGISGSFVGLGVGTTSCNNGNVPFNWFQLSNTDHPVIPQNLYRMSANGDRFEQIGQSWLKHAFTALEENACGFGCTTQGCTTGTHLCPGCSDPYGASLNYSQSGLGSRAWVNPFTGAFPSTAASHTGHTHTGTSHRLTVAMSDLNTTLNTGATYFAEGQYVTPHEYTWCQSNPGQCNMYNNVSYRQFSVSSTDQQHFTFSSIGSTVRMRPAIFAWDGATVVQFEPDPGNDGIAFLGCKVTNPSAGVWHYEYAVYNENLDRGIQSFSIPLGPGIVISNIAFRAPAQEPGWASDGTVGNTGFSSTPWTPTQTSSAISWASETFAQNQNANAIRWGTLYNFRFDANKPPNDNKASLGFYKTGSPLNVDTQVPTPDSSTPSPTPSPTPAPTGTPTPTPTPTATPVVVSLPVASIDTGMTNFTQPVTASNIDTSSNLIGFQGDFTFDETVVTFQSPPVASAGLTAGTWTVAGNVIPGAGPIRTLRVSAFVNDGKTPLTGAGTLFNLNMTRVSGTPGANTPLVWAASPNNFVFIDTNLSIVPSSGMPGSITITAPPTVSISGNVDYCSNPGLTAVPGVTMTLSGSAAGSTATDGAGNYTFAALASGGSYTITPSKTALAPGSTGISTVDVVAVQRHFLNIALIPPGCRLTAADVNGDTNITTVDVVAIQRFFLGISTGIANVGKYSFTPASRSYPGIASNQTAQNYDTIVFGDVASTFVHRGESTPALDGASESPATVAGLTLPANGINRSRTSFTAPVLVTAIDRSSNLVGFQADFTFDALNVRFESDPVRKAGLTSGNWNVSGNVLPGTGPVRTLRISAYSTDFEPLTGEGTLFELRFAGVDNPTGPALIQNGPNPFLFIDANLNVQKPEIKF